MTKKLNKRGFTIVELVVVIVVIAILAAVLIPTISNLVSKANKNKDTQLVRNLNTALAADVNKHNTMSEALAAAAEFGYDVAKINASEKDNEILWDSVNDVFCYLDEGKVTYIPNSKEKDVKDYQLWKIYTEAPTTQTYSIYWNTDSNEVPATLTVGFDAGKYATNLNLTYANSGDAQDVTIRTNGGTLTINAPQDTVRHYGNAATVNVTAIAGNSYHAHGTVGVITVTSGHVVVENGATVSTITKSSSATESDTVSITNNGTITAAVGVDVAGTAPATKVENKDIKSTLTAEGGYVQLSADQTISETLTIVNDTVLDLNGKTLTVSILKITSGRNLTLIDTAKATEQMGCIICNRYIFLNGGSLIVNDGKITTTFADSTSSLIYVSSKSSLTVNGGTIENPYIENATVKTKCGGNAIYVYGSGAKCIINGGTISGANIALTGNGTNTNWGTYIEINGGKIINSNNLAIYHPQVGTLNINGGHIEGYSAIYQKAGTMNITGGTFVATKEYTDYTYSGSGANSTGDCIIIDACKGYGNGTTVANITLDSVKISVNSNSIGKAQKVKGYVYNSDNAPIIIWNGEAVSSIDVSSK